MTLSTTPREGVLSERDDLAYLDTRALAWEPLPGLPDAQRKVLTRNGQGEPLVFLFHLPPGFAPDGLPRRHTDRSVTEVTLALAGELPMWEYSDADQQHGTFVRQRPGYAAHRLPGSLHGLEPGRVTPVGFTGLMIRTGPGNRVEVPYAAGWRAADDQVEARPEPGSGVVVDRPGVRIVDSEAMEWTPLGQYGRGKVLARDASGSPLLMLQHVGPEFALPGHPERHSHEHDQHDLVLWGEFPMAEYERGGGPGRQILMKAGHFVHRRGGEIHGLVSGATSPTGCLTLQWYTDGQGNLVVGGGGTVDET